MTRFDIDSSKVDSYVSVESIDHEKAQEQTQEHVTSKTPCETHGSGTPFIDRNLRTARGQEAIRILSTALTDLVDENKCTKCTVENLVPLLEGHLKDLKLAKQNGEWSKEDKKTLKAEFKSLFKPAKKSLKNILKGN
ncbi:hypothetical protein N7481_002375 [Penicillium waksmanii]|uniref:uncharacterized protein n=1 Tax=Penicillium waksmanii TaxID=69791 RepID=UPI0025493739|nr:uncharacterized protein N7481_002375 [Penicillium waksmanii]KAJ5995398.1 hypothetical protein N7481_002375 [Penicillium waksmanii]